MIDAFGFAVAVRYQFREERNVRDFERPAIAGEPFGVRLKTKLIADVGDSPVPKPDKVLGGLPACRGIVDHHRVHELAGMLIVDQHSWNSHFVEQRHIEGSDSGRSNQNSIHTSFVKRVHNFYFSIRVCIGVSQEYRVAVIIGDFLDPADDFRNKRVGDSRNHDSNRFCSPSDKAPGDGAWPVAFLTSDLLNAHRRLRIHQRAVMKSPRHR